MPQEKDNSKDVKNNTHSFSDQDLYLGLKAFFPIVPNFHSSSSTDVTPANNIVGRFQTILTKITNPYLCEYVEVVKGKHDRLFIVSEHYISNAREKLKKKLLKNNQNSKGFSEEKIAKMGYEILTGLKHLHSKEIVCHNLTTEHILFNRKKEVKLADYGLYFVTDFGSLVSFPICNPHYMSPESILLSNSKHGIKHDIWSFGIILLELLEGKIMFSNENYGNFDENPSLILNSILQLCCLDSKNANLTEQERETNFQKNLQNFLDGLTNFKNSSIEFQEIIKHCLHFQPTKRFSSSQLLEFNFFQKFDEMSHKKNITKKDIWVKKPFLQCSLVDVQNQNGQKMTLNYQTDSSKQNVLNLTQIYHFWKLAGNNVETSLNYLKDDFFQEISTIERIPKLFSIEFDSKNQQINQNDQSLLYNESIIPISIKELREKFDNSSSDLEKLTSDSLTNSGGFKKKLNVDEDYYKLLQDEVIINGQNLTVLERENNIDYQRLRILIFRKLLQNYPDPTDSIRFNFFLIKFSVSFEKGLFNFTKLLQNYPDLTDSIREEILNQARTDIPPVLRAEIWFVILGLKENEVETVYNQIDKTITGVSDKQIELDIPRCHQYNTLLSSNEGQKKLKRILKSWVSQQTSLVYWQGLDSVLAPFLVLFFNKESSAYCCLIEITEKYLHDFYLAENFMFLQYYLNTFRLILNYHEPQLGIHLHELGFSPDLYVIPWFLTFFAHIFPLEKVFPIWDKILLGPPSLPLFIAVAILQQMKEILLPLDFDTTMLLFTNLPDIDIGKTCENAEKMYQNTPISITMIKSISEIENQIESKSIDELKEEFSATISVQDLLDTNKILLDIRTEEEFLESHIQNSIHLEISKKKAANSLAFLEERKGQQLVIIANNNKASKFANKLVSGYYEYISIFDFNQNRTHLQQYGMLAA